MRKIRLFLLLVIAATVMHACRDSKNPLPFYDEITQFKDADKKHFPPRDAILFVGSSSIRLWNHLESYFPGFTIIKRGFGGSGLDDAIRYADDIIIPYHPKQILIYSGENDIAMGVSSTAVLQKFMELFKLIRQNLPEAGILYISIKPSPSREKYMPVMEEANVMIRQFLSSYPGTTYIDIYHPMLGADGKPIKELFKADDLHMNDKGYEIWKTEITPHLVK